MPFRSIVGHRRLLALLTRAIAGRTLPPALLLAGPAGVGKRRVAMAVAQALNCLHPVRDEDGLAIDADGECSACRRIARGVHPDVIVIEPGDSGSIKIEQVRDAIDRAAYRPFEGARRVVIIDDAEALVPAAQNALLKTLEEPPSASVFILVSSMPDALLPTILSRCPRLRFSGLSPDEVATVLMRDHEYAEADARAAAADSNGSVGVALEQQSVDVAAARTTAQRLLEQVGRTNDRVRLIDAAKELTGKTQTSAADRDQLGAILRATASLLRDLGILDTQSDPRSLANVDLADQLRRLLTTFHGDRITRAYAVVDEALGALQRNVSPKVVADWVVLQL